MSDDTAVPRPAPHYLTVRQTIEAYPVLGRTRLYELIAAGEIESFTLGRRRVIVAPSVDAYLQRLQRQSAASVA